MTTNRPQGNCPICDGHGTRINTFNQVRRCGTCRGTRNVEQAVADRIVALQVLHQAITTCPDRSLGCDATQGLSLLRDRQPEREAPMVASIRAGRVTEVVRHLAAYYREAYPA